MRPTITCHMISSVDGRLVTERWTSPTDGQSKETLLDHYFRIEEDFDADGWIVGRKTMADYATAPARNIRAGVSIPRTTYIGQHHGRNLAITLDPHGKLHYGKNEIEGDHPVAILSEQVSDDYLAELREDGVSYLFAGTDGHDLNAALNTLASEFNVRTLLLEGGGLINGTFLKAGLIDELSLLIYPGIDGLSGVSSIVEYIGKPDELPGAGQSLQHVHTETLEGGVVWLRYRFERAEH